MPWIRVLIRLSVIQCEKEKAERVGPGVGSDRQRGVYLVERQQVWAMGWCDGQELAWMDTWVSFAFLSSALFMYPYISLTCRSYICSAYRTRIRWRSRLSSQPPIRHWRSMAQTVRMAGRVTMMTMNNHIHRRFFPSPFVSALGLLLVGYTYDLSRSCLYI